MMEKTREINLQEIFYALLNRLWLIVLCACIAGAAVYGYTANFITPLYRASVTIYVNNYSTDSVGIITSSDLATSQKLVDTYVTILQERSVLEKVSEKVLETTGKAVSPGAILGMMNASAKNETEVFAVHISHADPDMAKCIADAIADVGPKFIEKIVEGSSTRIVSSAVRPSAPYTPNRMQNTVYGAMIGAVAAIAFVVLRVLMDVRIKGEEDLAQVSDAPVLGVIPHFETEEKDGYGYKTGEESPESEAVAK